MKKVLNENIGTDKRDFTCWVVTEDLAGTRNQCLGVTDALGVVPTVKTIQLKQPWKALCPYIGFEQSWSFQPRFEGPWPNLLITAGRKSIAAARYIKRQSPHTFSVHLQDPKITTRAFDLIALPAHDTMRGDNVLVTTGAPNRITGEKLKDAKKAFPEFKKITPSRIAVLIGGNSKAYKMSPNIMRSLCHQLKSMNAGLMITASRRTGEENLKILQNLMADTGAYIWDGEGENPYLGMLAWADAVMVTADSVSMLCDAATAGKPMYVIPLDGGNKRFDSFHETLLVNNIARLFEGEIEHWEYQPLNDAQIVATEIKRQMALQD